MAKRKIVKVIKKKRPGRVTSAGKRPVTRKPLRRQQRVQPAALPVNAAMVTLEDRQIATMVADPRFVAAIPCLQNGKSEMKQIGKRCGRCNKKRTKARRAVMKEVRTCIARMSGQEKNTLKSLIGTKKVQVMVANGKSVRSVVF